MSVDYEYDFTHDLYRARVKTKYKREDMSMSDWIYSNPFEFRGNIDPDFVDTGLGWGANRHYLVYDQDTEFDRVYQPGWYTRGFFKFVDGWAVAVNACPSYTGYCGPIMIALKEPDGKNQGAYYRTQWGYDVQYAEREFEYLGMTWVVTYYGMWMAGNNNPNLLDDVPDFDITQYGGDEVAIARAILQAAGVTKTEKTVYSWIEKSWTIDDEYALYGYYVWHDGNDTYLTGNYGSQQFKLNRSTNTWNRITWNGDNIPEGGHNIWSDGNNIYWSHNSTHYMLNRSTNSWETKTWNGLTELDGEFDGERIWTDGINIYLSYGISYVLNKSTSTWSRIWLDQVFIYGDRIWTDGTNFYCTISHDTFVLKNNTWQEKTWSENINVPDDGQYIWNDNGRVYYSDYNTQYVFNKKANKWEQYTHTDLDYLDGRYIWHDLDKTYYSGGGLESQYVRV